MTPKTTYTQLLSVCPECASRKTIQDGESGEIVCKGCGLVISEPPINTGPEWRDFTLDEKESRSRVGPFNSFSFYDKGLSTVIGPIGLDYRGKKLPEDTKKKMFRLKKWNRQSRTQESANRNMSKAMTEMNRLADRLHIPRFVKEEAAVIYRKAFRKGIQGRSISSLAAVSLYAACRMTQTPRTLDEVARHSPRDKRDIARCYRRLLWELKLRMPLPKAQLCVHRIASDMDFGEETQRIAIVILGAAKRFRMTVSKDPMGIAAAALNLACLMNGENCNQTDVAYASGVTEVTIQNRYKELKSVLYPAFSGSESLTT